MSDDHNRTYAVVVSDEKQCSIWPDDREPPPGWHRDGVSGSGHECIARIDRARTDMRSLSPRRRMQEQASVAGA